MMIADYFRCCVVKDLVLRVCFILGNLTAKLENARSHLFAQPSAADTLLSVFNFYSAKDLKVCTSHIFANRHSLAKDRFLVLDRLVN